MNTNKMNLNKMNPNTNYELHLFFKKIYNYEPCLFEIIESIIIYYYHKLPMYKIIKLKKHHISIIELNDFIVQIKLDLYKGIFIKDSNNTINKIKNIKHLIHTYNYITCDLQFNFIDDLLLYYNGCMTNTSINILIYIFDLNTEYNIEYLISNSNFVLNKLLYN